MKCPQKVRQYYSKKIWRVYNKLYRKKRAKERRSRL